MEHIYCRCKHCGKTYTYCTYGNGPAYGTQEGCSREYCGDCQTAINKALERIPRRYVGKFCVLDNKEGLPVVNEVFDREKKKYYQNKKFNCAQMVKDFGYEWMEKCIINFVEYIRGEKPDGTMEVQVLKEFDLLENRFTGNLYEDYTNDRDRYIPVAQLKFSSLIEERRMTPPAGKLLFDF